MRERRMASRQTEIQTSLDIQIWPALTDGTVIWWPTHHLNISIGFKVYAPSQRRLAPDIALGHYVKTLWSHSSAHIKHYIPSQAEKYILTFDFSHDLQFTKSLPCEWHACTLRESMMDLQQVNDTHDRPVTCEWHVLHVSMTDLRRRAIEGQVEHELLLACPVGPENVIRILHRIHQDHHLRVGQHCGTQI